MNNEKHPITPPQELIDRLRNEAWHTMYSNAVEREINLIRAAYQAGTDYQLEECIRWMIKSGYWGAISMLRSAMRPKPPNLKQQALEALDSLPTPAGKVTVSRMETIRQALELLPDEEV